MERRIKSVTLLELLIAMVLLLVIVLGLSSINLFSQFHVITADRWSRLQNETSLVLDHMQKNVMRASGFINNRGIVAWNPAGGRGFRVRIDVNNTPANYNDDTWVGYRQNAGATQIRFCNNINPATWQCIAGGWETLANHILPPVPPPGGFTYAILGAPNTAVGVNVTIIARWNPGRLRDLDNPELTKRAEMRSHSASSH